MKCPICNHENPQKAKFCQSCGTKLEGKPCPDCGYINREGVNFCEECGYAFKQKEKVELEPETSQKTKAPHPHITQPPPPQVVIIKEEEKKEKRRLPGWLWAILGVVLTLTCLCSLLWFKVVDLPEGILAKLPGPVADIVEAIEEGNLNDLPIVGGLGKEAGVCKYKFEEVIFVNYYNISADDGDIAIRFPDKPKIPQGTFNIVEVTINGDKHKCRWDYYKGGWNELLCEKAPIFDYMGKYLRVTVTDPKTDCELFNGFVAFDKKEFPEEEEELEEVECLPINVTSIIFNWTSPTILQVTVDRDEPWEVGWWMEITLGGTSYWPDPGDCAISSTNPSRFVCQITVEDSYSGVGEIKLLSPETCPYYYDASVPEAALCPLGQTYYPGWPYNGGCCTDGCWCKKDGKWGCWTTCAKKCK